MLQAIVRCLMEVLNAVDEHDLREVRPRCRHRRVHEDADCRRVASQRVPVSEVPPRHRAAARQANGVPVGIRDAGAGVPCASGGAIMSTANASADLPAVAGMVRRDVGHGG